MNPRREPSSTVGSSDHLGPTEGKRHDTFLVFGSPDIRETEIHEVVATLQSDWLGTGPKTQQFQEQFSDYVGCNHALALNSCTAGMHLALDVLDIGQGEEVITTPITFAPTANVMIHRGARPVFADVRRAK